jgi:hypothetical protein
MQQSKGIKTIQETAEYFDEPTLLTKMFQTLLMGFKLSYINSILSKSKSRGIDGKLIFQKLFLLKFVDFKNINQLISSGFAKEIDYKKDVFYEFMKNENIDWRRIMYLFSLQFLRIIRKNEDSGALKLPKFLIVDDSILEKSGKKIECIGKVFNHCTHTYTLGMKILTLGFWDGKSFAPVDFSIHNEPGKNKNRGLKDKELLQQFSKKRDLNSPGYLRTLEISVDKIENAIAMITNAFKKGFDAQYVLADSWFISEKFIKEVTALKNKKVEKLNVIGIMKSNRILQIGTKKFKGTDVPELYRKNVKFSRKYKCSYIRLKVDYKGITLNAFWIRMKGQDSWKMLVTTDQNISFSTTMEYYQTRWTIEVFFKECKQYFGFNSCQSTDFDSQIASISICFMNFTVLSLKKRFSSYETLGMLFRDCKENLLELTLVEKIKTFLITIFIELFADLGVEWELFIPKIINNEYSFLQNIKNSFDCLFSTRIVAT